MFEVAREEANKFRWIESEKAGYDLGETAIRLWVVRHWTAFVRARVLEHLTGQRFWVELDRDDFGILCREFPNDTELVREIVNQLATGADNLTVLSWAVTTGQPTRLVAEVLQVIDINQRRISCPFPDDAADAPHIVQG